MAGESDTTVCSKPVKPLGRKAYGSIGHLPNSRLGPADHCVTDGQARIATIRKRDRHDTVVVQEKLDGSCVSVAMIDDRLHALSRAGWPALSSPYELHHVFDQWVREHETLFYSVLKNGERIVGEWIAQAHGTIYTDVVEPFIAFDIMTDATRITFDRFLQRVGGTFLTPHVISDNDPLSVDEAMRIHRSDRWHYPCDEVEGVVYRVERKGEVDFLCKWVRSDKVDGKLLPSVTGKSAVLNWSPGGV